MVPVRAEVHALGSLFAVYLAAVASPGPNTFIVTRVALAQGRRSASLAVLGIAVGNLVWLGLVLAAAELLLAHAPGLVGTLRIVGGLYLSWLGFRALWTAIRGGDLLSRGTTDAPPVSSFRAGLLTSLTNPNTLPFYVSLLAGVLLPAVAGWVRYAAAGGVLVLCVLWYGFLAWGFSSALVQARYQRWAWLINLALAGGLLAFGVRMLRQH
jgi:threonine/homoserine/homoserine lactone efflux protein